jgi:hypothetical protein
MRWLHDGRWWRRGVVAMEMVATEDGGGGDGECVENIILFCLLSSGTNIVIFVSFRYIDLSFFS